MSGRIAYEPSLVSEEVDINVWFRHSALHMGPMG